MMMGIPAQKISQQTRNDVLGNVSHARKTQTLTVYKKYIYYSLVFSNHLDTRAEKLPVTLTE